MPRYRFTGYHETVLTGLAHGVNAELHRLDEDGEPVDFTALAESTVVALPGDEVTTDEPYPNAWMVNVDTDQPDLFLIGEQGPELRRFPAGTVVLSAELTAQLVPMKVSELRAYALERDIDLRDATKKTELIAAIAAHYAALSAITESTDPRGEE